MKKRRILSVILALAAVLCLTVPAGRTYAGTCSPEDAGFNPKHCGFWTEPGSSTTCTNVVVIDSVRGNTVRYQKTYFRMVHHHAEHHGESHHGEHHENCTETMCVRKTVRTAKLTGRTRYFRSRDSFRKMRTSTKKNMKKFCRKHCGTSNRVYAVLKLRKGKITSAAWQCADWN